RGQLDEHPATARRVSRCLPVNRLAAALGAARGRHAPPRGRPLNSRIPRRYPGAAMPRADHYPDPEHYFAETRMSFGDHIEDLRTHLIRAIAGFVIGMIIAFSFGMWVFHFITAPVESQLMEFYNRRVTKEMKKLEDGETRSEELNRLKEVPAQIRAADLKAILRKWGLPVPEAAASDEEEWIDLG